MKNFFKSFGNFLRAAPKLLVFELLYKLMLVALGAPLLSFLLKIAMKYSGVSYISASSLKKFLLDPVTAAVLILMLFIAAFFTIVELSSLAVGFSCIRSHKKITLAGIMKCGLSAFAKAFRGTGIIRFFGFMLIVPLTQFTLSSGIISAPLIPIVQSLFGTSWRWLSIAGYILIESAVFFFLSIRCYSLHYLVLTDLTFTECIRKSRSRLDGKRMRIFFTLLIWSIVTLGLAAVLTFIISFAVIFGIKGFSAPEAALTSSLKVLSYAWEVFIAVSAVISPLFIMGCLTESFFTGDVEAKTVLPEPKKRKVPIPVRFLSFTVLAAVCVFLNFSYIQEIYRGNISMSIGVFNSVQVTAHRGFSYAAPENTLYAFEKAIDAGADYIELDVQQTADGQLVIFHDQTLNRTSDGKGLLSSYTYEELLEFSYGSWFGSKDGEDYSDAEIMLLSEALELVKDSGCMLNIEIKKSGNTAETAEKAAELIKEYGMTGSCYVTSFSYSALKAVKNVEPKIKTAIIANIASPSFYMQLKYIDALSLNYIFVNQSIITNAHKNGKRIFVWTVDTRSDMERMISLGVDNIITDRPDIALNTVYSYGKGDLVISLLNRLFGS